MAWRTAGLARRRALRVSQGPRALLLRRRLMRLTSVEAAAGRGCLSQVWAEVSAQGFLISVNDRERLLEVCLNDYPREIQALRDSSERALAHEFTLLGSKPHKLEREIDWQLDFKSGRRWPLQPSHKIDYAELGKPSDVKVPWELSRCQHLVTLGRAWFIFQERRYLQGFQDQVRSWIRSNPVGLGINWVSSMDVALRAISWIWSLDLFRGAFWEEGFEEDILFELYRHGAWISENLEIGRTNGNHVIANALGLLACGAAFAPIPEASGWIEKGASLLEEEMEKQVDRQGVDFEASVAYQRLVLEVFLIARQLCGTVGRSLSESYEARLERMFEYVHAYVTPDGLSPQIGDADDGRVVVLGKTEIRDHRYLLSTGAVLFRRADFKGRAGKFWEDSLWLLGPSAKEVFDSLPAKIVQKSRAFPEAGFYILRSSQQYLFVDLGPVGFEGRGGHGHNDCLSFDWHALGQPLLTDSGTYLYTASVEWRNRFRSTAFHNTIRVDRQELNRFISTQALWRLRNDARPLKARFSSQAEVDILEGGHVGYRRLDDPVTVHRRFEFSRQCPRIIISDYLEGRAEHLIEFFFHGALGAEAVRYSESTVGFRWREGNSVSIQATSDCRLQWKGHCGWFSPSYGVKMRRPVWIARATVSLPLHLCWKLSARQSGPVDPSAQAEKLLPQLAGEY